MNNDEHLGRRPSTFEELRSRQRAILRKHLPDQSALLEECRMTIFEMKRYMDMITPEEHWHTCSKRRKPDPVECTCGIDDLLTKATALLARLKEKGETNE